MGPPLLGFMRLRLPQCPIRTHEIQSPPLPKRPPRPPQWDSQKVPGSKETSTPVPMTVTPSSPLFMKAVILNGFYLLYPCSKRLRVVAACVLPQDLHYKWTDQQIQQYVTDFGETTLITSVKEATRRTPGVGLCWTSGGEREPAY
jgi:hypothetical protein